MLTFLDLGKLEGYTGWIKKYVFPALWYINLYFGVTYKIP